MRVGFILDEMPEKCNGCPVGLSCDYTNFHTDRPPDDCPLLEVEPVKHGRWKVLWGYDGDLREPTEDFECTVCHEQYKVGYFKYCPNCGAKMDGGAE